MRIDLPDGWETHYTQTTNEVYAVCPHCGALTLARLAINHDDWHKTLKIEIFSQVVDLLRETFDESEVLRKL